MGPSWRRLKLQTEDFWPSATHKSVQTHSQSLRMGIHPGSGVLVVCTVLLAESEGWNSVCCWLCARNYPARTHHQDFCSFSLPLVLVCAMTQLVCVYVIWLQLEMVSARCIIKIIMIMGWGALSHVPLSSKLPQIKEHAPGRYYAPRV